MPILFVISFVVFILLLSYKNTSHIVSINSDTRRLCLTTAFMNYIAMKSGNLFVILTVDCAYFMTRIAASKLSPVGIFILKTMTQPRVLQL